MKKLLENKVEELDNADGVPSEKALIKDTNSPEETSRNSIDSPISYHEVKDDSRVDKSNENNKPQNYSDPASQAQSDVLGTVRATRPTPAVGFPCPTVPQNLGTQPLQSTTYRPGASTSTALMSSSQYPRPISVNSTPNARPMSVPHSMPNSIGNPPSPGPFGLSQPYNPPSPTATIPVNNSAPVYGLAHGPGSNPGPSNLTHGHDPNQGASNLAPSLGSNSGPSNLAHGPGPTPGPSNLAQGPVPNQGPSNFTHEPLFNQGPEMMPIRHRPTVEFANLPPSTTFLFLTKKLSRVGPIIFLRYIPPGRAVVTFTSCTDAIRCCQIYDGMVVEGFRIDAKIL